MPRINFLMEFVELSDGKWVFIKLLLPPKAKVRRPGADDKLTIDDLICFDDQLPLDWVDTSIR